MLTVLRYHATRTMEFVPSRLIKTVLLSRERLENGSKLNYSKRSDENDSDSDQDELKTRKDRSAKVERSGKETKVAISSSLLDKILTMKVTGTKDDDGTETTIDLAKPTGKWRNVKKKLFAEHEAEVQLEKSGLNSAIVSAVKNVATSLSGDRETTESELLKKLKDHGLETEAGKGGNVPLNLSDMVTGMKIDRTKSNRDLGSTSTALRGGGGEMDGRRDTTTTSTYVKHVSTSSKISSQRRVSQVDLFGAEPLNIFTDKSETPVDVSVSSEWEKLERRELDLLVLHPPANGFEEMITWTKQGKLWLFPIDNEQGMDQEAKVGFHEHVFLEPEIDEGFPKKGPIRHFMELVVVGLSKNPYLTVERKKEHIEWFRQYFKDKEATLKEVGALN